MNSWFKIALYSFIGAVIGSLLLGIVSTGTGLSYNGVPDYGQGLPYTDYHSMPYGTNGYYMPMHNGNMHGGMMGGGMGMGMMKR